tara:strand:+ start:6677 stop:7963 length:1287 start_codon:yes stop_codon:yes gene_type:complete
MEEENKVSQEQLVQEKAQDDGVVKVDLRNFKQEENGVQSENNEETGVRVPSGDVPGSIDDATTDQSKSKNSDENEEKPLQDDEKSSEDGQKSSEDDEEPQQDDEKSLQDDGEPAGEVRVLEEVVDEEDSEETVSKNVEEDPEPAEVEDEKVNLELPENIEKLVEFMNETGGSLEDYVELNKDIDALDQDQLVVEYYKSTKPHLNNDEINFLIEDSYSFNEEEDDDRDIKRKKLLYKEEVQKAKKYLNDRKSKYYDEIKTGSRLTPDQQKAVDFFNRYEKENKESSQLAERQANVFVKKTDALFNDKFKGFEYSVGEKRYRFNVKDVSKVKQTQSDLSNFTGRFLDKDMTIGDAKGYHKALFTAMNADAVAEHFYQQGKADAMKESSARAKNVNMDPRGQHEQTTQVGGMKVRAVSGDDSGRLRIKIGK